MRKITNIIINVIVYTIMIGIIVILILSLIYGSGGPLPEWLIAIMMG